VSGLRAILKGDIKEVRMIVKAHWGFFLKFGFWYQKRKQSQQLITTPNLNAIYPNSIIVDYFLKKKTLYSALGNVETEV
jgi:hypothetical protein